MNAFRVNIEKKSFGRPNSQRHDVLINVRFDVGPKEFVCIVGPSGSGKTTALNIIAGLDTAYGGAIDLAGQSRDRPLAYLFQAPRLLPWRTLLDNVALPLKKHDDAQDLAANWLDKVGLAGFRDIYPGQASLGMQRRAALARAFALDPSILLMDEPFVSLDENSATELRTLLSSLWQAQDTAVLFVTHDMDEAASLATRVIVFAGQPATVAADMRDTGRWRCGSELRNEIARFAGVKGTQP